MEWIKRFDLFLFDFDGLLVNTEPLHYQAYQLLCSHRGFVLDWNFTQFCEVAHADAGALQRALYLKFPQLYQQEPDWRVLYREKKALYCDLLELHPVELMPGVEPLLLTLQQKGIRRAVATHSPKKQITRIRAHLPLLDTIGLWVTREDYLNPKPAPDAYLKAIAQLGKTGDKIVGFEDSLRGLQALMGTQALPVLIAEKCPEALAPRARYFPSFDKVAL